MNTFLLLLLAHLLGDFPLQSNRIVRWKSSRRWGVALHAAVHTATTAALLRHPERVPGLFLVLAPAHFLIDRTKIARPIRNEIAGFVLDQVAHLATLLVLSARWPALEGRVPPRMLPRAVGLALLPAALITLTVVARAKKEEPGWQRLAAQQPRLIRLSQAVGWLLIVWMARALRREREGQAR